jgi:hypothetical protein
MPDKKQVEDTTKKLPELTEAEKVSAEKEGIKAAMSQSAQTNFATQSGLESPDYEGDRWPDRHEIMKWSYIVDLGLEEFKKVISAEADVTVPESKVAGLLELERSGKNRTQYVEALCKRLGVKSPLEVTNSGPGHTNDVTEVTKVVK